MEVIFFHDIKTIPNPNNYKMWTIMKFLVNVLAENFKTTVR